MQTEAYILNCNSSVKGHHLFLLNNLWTYLYPAMIECWVLLTHSLKTIGTQYNDSMFPL